MTITAGSSQSPVPANQRDWKLVKSVSNEQGGTLDFVVVPEGMNGNRSYYEQIANEICGTRSTCTVHFWADLKHVPTSAWMAGSSLSHIVKRQGKLTPLRH